MLAAIITVATLAAYSLAVFVGARFGNSRCIGDNPVPTLTFIAILFTSGLDVGLLMFPLVDFKLFSDSASYNFANPLAIEFGFWGFLVWLFYFNTTTYFCLVEPKLKLFQIPIIKWANNIAIIGTCAFTAYLFLSYLPDYVEGIEAKTVYGLVGFTILFAAISSSRIAFLKVLSLSSTILFFLMIILLAISSGMGIGGFLESLSNLKDYFLNLDRFVTPVDEYHQFYLYWWFAWSIMIGQFVARFTNGLRTSRLLMLLLIVPSIPIAVWFSVLYHFFSNDLILEEHWKLVMVAVGVLFVINSLDSLIRLYSENIGFTAAQVGNIFYVATNSIALASLVLFYRFTPLKIEWIGLLVIGIYCAVGVMMHRRRSELSTVTT